MQLQNQESVLVYIFFLNAQVGGILRILESDWLWEWVEFFYLARQPGQNLSPGCVSLSNGLTFSFFDTESVYTQKCFKTDFKMFSHLLHSLSSTVRVNNLKSDFREEERSASGSIFKTLVTVLRYTDLPPGK